MKGIDVKLLRAFVILAEKGSYHKAAEALYLTQPALSKQIQTLESIIGEMLFQRDRHGAKITEVGKKLLSKAHELLILHADFIDFAKNINNDKENTLRLGIGISSFQSVPVWIKLFKNKFPHCHLTVNHLASSVQISMLQEGRLHVGFLRLPAPETLVTKMLNEERLILAFHTDEVLAENDIQGLLLSHPVLEINPDISPCLAQQTRVFLQDNHLIANLIAAADDIPALLALIAGGNGVAFLPASVKSFLPKGVTTIDLRGAQKHWDIGMVWNPHITNRLRDEFLDIVTQNS